MVENINVGVVNMTEDSLKSFIDTLPKFVHETITNIVQTSPGLSRNDVFKAYQDFYNHPAVQNDSQFPTAEDRHRYCCQAIWVRFKARPPMQTYNLIPWGFDGMRKTRKGHMQSALYIVLHQKNGLDIRRVVLRGKMADMYRNVNLWSYYRDVKLGQFRNSKDLIADDRTEFKNPRPIKPTPEQLINDKRLKIKRITVREAPDNPSAKDSTGYTIRTDLRVIRAMVSSPPRIFERDDGTKGAVYNISDMTSITKDGQQSETGGLIKATMTVWCPPEFAVYDVYSVCDFIGYVSISNEKTGEASMNCVSIIPVVEMKMEGEPEMTEEELREPEID